MPSLPRSAKRPRSHCRGLPRAHALPSHTMPRRRAAALQETVPLCRALRGRAGQRARARRGTFQAAARLLAPSSETLSFSFSAMLALTRSRQRPRERPRVSVSVGAPGRSRRGSAGRAQIPCGQGSLWAQNYHGPFVPGARAADTSKRSTASSPARIISRCAR